MKTKLLALALLAGSSMFAESRFSIGINVGGYGRGYYPAAPPYAAARPLCPGPDYAWTDGYWDQSSGRDTWRDGYWNRQAYRGYEDQPRYDNGYGRQDYNRGYVQNRNRSFERDRFENRGFKHDRDDNYDRNRDRREDYRQGSGFRNR